MILLSRCPECGEELSGTETYQYCCKLSCMWDSAPPLSEEQAAYVEAFFSGPFVLRDEPAKEES